jgi:hypothetical protein
MNSIMVGQANEARDLGIDVSEIGCDCQKVGESDDRFFDSDADESELAEVGLNLNPFKAISSAVKTVKGVPVLGLPLKAADSVLHSKYVGTLQKLFENPIVSTALGPVAIPNVLLLAAAKEGPKGLLRVANKELHNPVRQAAVAALAVVFPPLAPAAVCYAGAAKIVDASRSKNKVEAIKAAAQIAATIALSKTGNADAIKGLDYIKKAKAIADKMPPVSDLTNLSHGRVEVCGAKSDEHRGVWFKTHVYREGRYLCATMYSVNNANAEVFNFKVDMVPLLKRISSYHKKLHGTAPSVSGFGDQMNVVAEKLGRAKLAQQAFAVSSQLTAKATCHAQTPNVPVSNAVLATYAAARAGVDAVDKNAKLKSAMEAVGNNIHRLIETKKSLSAMAPAQRATALQNPTVRKAIIKGIGSKFALASFIKSGGPELAKKTRRNAIIASSQFSKLAAKAKAGDPNAKKMAKVISIAAHARAKTQQAVATSTPGSHAGLVINAQGKVRRNPKGFVKRTPRAGERAEVMVKARGGVETGVFEHVSGASATTLRKRLKRIRHMAVVNGDDAPGSEMGCSSPLALR